MANLDAMFESLINSDEKFRVVVLKQIDQKISLMEQELTTAKAARNQMAQGQVVSSPSPTTKGRRGRPLGSRNKPQGGVAKSGGQQGTHGNAILSILSRFPQGASSGQIAEELERIGHNVDKKVLYVTLYNGVNKYSNIRSEGPQRSKKYFAVAK